MRKSTLLLALAFGVIALAIGFFLLLRVQDAAHLSIRASLVLTIGGILLLMSVAGAILGRRRHV